MRFLTRLSRSESSERTHANQIPMTLILRLIALLSILASLLAAQPPAWKEFSIGPATPKASNNEYSVRQGILRAGSISLRSLIGIIGGVLEARTIGPEWMDSDHYAVAATLSDESRLRLRTRSTDDASIGEEFRSMLTQELVQRFHLEFHRETREGFTYTLRSADGRLKLRPAPPRERSRLFSNRAAAGHNVTLEARSATFRTIANWLQNYLKHPVAADTSLPGATYDFRLKWRSKDQPSLFHALKEQLGLELDEDARNQEYFVVDRAERPALPPASSPITYNVTPEPSATFTAVQLRRDLQVLREALEEGHAGIYRFTPKSELDQEFDRAAKQLNRRMTAMDFYRLLAPVVAGLKCGHTSLRPSGPMEQRLADEPLIPIEIAILGGKVYVARDYSAAAQLAGAEVLSINNVPIARILASMLAVSHGDGDSPTAGPYQLSHGRGFARSLYMIAGLRSPFRIRYVSGGKTAAAVLAGMPPKVIHEVELSRHPSSPQHGNANWRLVEGGSIGVLKITSFDGNAEGDVPMSAFFERVFREAHNGNVAKLILDVRDNGGGEDELGRVLFSYFADQPFRYYRDLVVNKLSFRFFQYVPDREPLPPNVHEMVKPGADGKYHVVGHPNWGIQQPAAPHFGGKVVVLMNGGSFSTTCEFLSTLHNHGSATFVGEETAGGYYGNSSGAAASAVLPNSKLILPVQLVGYYLAIEGDALGAHGIRPDHHVEYSIDDVLAGRDRAMEMALRLANEAPGGR
jgi:uncharacterized protein (TIGR03435 family)